MSADEVLLSRVNKIDRELRFWRVSGTFAVLSTVLAVTVAATSREDVPKVIQAREFQLVGEDGEIRAELRTKGINNTQLRLYDGFGKSEVSIAANDQRAIVSLKNDSKANRAFINADNLGGDIGLSKETDEGEVLTYIVGGKEGTFIRLKPLNGDETRIPEHKPSRKN